MSTDIVGAATTSLAIVDAFAVISDRWSPGSDAMMETTRLVRVGLTPEIVSAAQRAIIESLDDLDGPQVGGLAVYKSRLDPNIVQVSGVVNARNGLDANCATLFNAVLVRSSHRDHLFPVGEESDEMEFVFSQLSPRYRH